MSTKNILALMAAASLGLTAWGEDEAENTSDGEGEAKSEVAAAPVRKTAKVAYATLPLCRNIEAPAEVRKPGGEWEPAEEGRYYPLGTSCRTGKGGQLTLDFGAEVTVTIGDEAEFGTRAQTLGENVRAVVLSRGTVNVSVPENAPDGVFSVVSRGFVVKNLAGDSRYAYAAEGDGDKVTVRCVTGTLAMEGHHFDIPAMRAADEIVVRSSSDFLITQLNGTSGDYVVKLDWGVVTKTQIGDDGAPKQVAEKTTSEWHLSPDTKVIITRLAPAVGNRLSVHVMAYDAAGNPASGCCYSEGRAEINSGEMIPKAKSDGEELAKRAAEASEATTEAAVDEEESTDSEKTENTETKTEEKEEE